METKPDKLAVLLEIASKLLQIKTLPYSAMIDPTLHDIPKDADLSKRQVAHNILSSDKKIEVFYI